MRAARAPDRPRCLKTRRRRRALLDPNRELREASAEFDRTPTAYNCSRLATALLAKGQVDQAIEHFREAASGPYANDPSFQRRSALALMHAEAVAGAGRADARAVFEGVIAADNSTEAHCKYGQFLLAQGDSAGARRAFEAVLEHDRQGHHHSRELNRDWIAEAKGALKQLGNA